MLEICRNIAIFLLFASALSAMQSEKKNGKFIKVFILLIVLFMLFSPMQSLLGQWNNPSDFLAQLEEKIGQIAEIADSAAMVDITEMTNGAANPGYEVDEVDSDTWKNGSVKVETITLQNITIPEIQTQGW